MLQCLPHTPYVQIGTWHILAVPEEILWIHLISIHRTLPLEPDNNSCVQGFFLDCQVTVLSLRFIMEEVQPIGPQMTSLRTQLNSTGLTIWHTGLYHLGQQICSGRKLPGCFNHQQKATAETKVFLAILGLWEVCHIGGIVIKKQVHFPVFRVKSMWRCTMQ